jgi:hypothetical protein
VLKCVLLRVKVFYALIFFMTKTIETKSGVTQISDGTEYLHNNLYNISSTFMQTSNGAADMENFRGQRIGDKITLSGVAFTNQTGFGCSGCTNPARHGRLPGPLRPFMCCLRWRS